MCIVLKALHLYLVFQWSKFKRLKLAEVEESHNYSEGDEVIEDNDSRENKSNEKMWVINI